MPQQAHDTNGAAANNHRVAILIPCYNEGITIAQVVEDFAKALPGADVYVFDNNSADDTVSQAIKAGATVMHEPRQGKGNVVRSMFRKIDADIYVLVDGDATYSADDLHALLEPVAQGHADMVVGDRISSSSYDKQNTRMFHGAGNKIVCKTIGYLFRTDVKDVMSGYRAMSREFVSNLPVLSPGFEVETEMTLHCLDKRFILHEIPIQYKSRPANSYSKLNTFSDGWKVLKTIAMIFKNYKPMTFFGICAAVLATMSIGTGAMPIYEYFKYQYVFRVPSAVLAASFAILSMLLFCCGLILETIVHHFKEQYELTLLKKNIKERDKE